MVEYVKFEDGPSTPKSKKVSLFSFNGFVIPLVLINIGVFLLQKILGSGFENAFVLSYALAFSEPWRLVTSFFMHADIWHLLFNMWALFFFGSMVERAIGKRNFLILYMVSGLIVSIISSFVFGIVLGSNGGALGASGAVMSLIGVVMIFAPNLRIYLYGVIPVSMWQLGIIVVLLDVFGLFVDNGIGNFAHLIGFFLGIWYAYYFKKSQLKFYKKFAKGNKITLKEGKEYNKKFK